MIIRMMAAGLVCAMAWATTAQAVTYAEAGDTGDLPGTAQQVGPGVTSITGEMGTGDIDMFGLYHAGGSFSASTVGGAVFDTVLWLFDSSGVGVFANDDDFSASPAVQSTISLSALAPGSYYLALTYLTSVEVPTNASSGDLWDDDAFVNGAPDGPGAAAPITGWTDVFPSAPTEPSYEITITQTGSPDSDPEVVPEPISAGLGMMALMGVTLAASRRRRA